MSRAGEAALLPAGLQDILPPAAAFEAETVERLLAVFGAHGYERVKPPLIEFEDNLLSGPGASMSPHSFRLMDPVTHRMLALRADMTLQVARIAATRLRNAPRPLRLGYAGQVLRVKGSQLRPERQFGQVGFELIGAPSAAADAEAVLLAAESLAAIGIHELSIDLNLPVLAPAVASALGLEAETTATLVAALDRKDAAAVEEAAGRHAPLFVALLAAMGPAPRAMERLGRLDLPESAASGRARLADVVGLIRAAAPDLALTVDPAEHRGLEYHTGVGFTVFARRVRGELGRGGHYVSGKGEASTGCTLYTDTLLRALPPPAGPRRVFVAFGTARARAAGLRAKGWATVAGLEPVADQRAEARRQGCTHLLVGRAVRPVGD